MHLNHPTTARTTGINPSKVLYDDCASPMDFRNQLSDRDRRAVSFKFKSRKTKFRERYAR